MNYKKKFIKSITIAVFIFTVLIVWRGYVQADWIDPRAGVRATPPIFDRDGRINLPTDVPTQPPAAPTATPRVGGPSISPVPTSSSGSTGGGNSSSTDDPCASGKSYSGPYCGWSPSVGSGDSGTGSPRIGGGEPQVLGLSYTAGDGISWSDIIFLTGVLCLLLYARSKLSKEIRV